MKVVTSGEMRRIDTRTIEEYGIPELVLMERAGLSVANRVCELFSPQKTIVLAGGGNNGGDGFAAARILRNRGWNVKVFFLSKEQKASRGCKTQLRAAKKYGVPVAPTPPEEKDFHAAIVVDAIFGTGLSKPVSGQFQKAIDLINRYGEHVISVDMPSGISSDTGEVMGAAVEADCTVTFGLPKRGHLLYPGAGHSGRLYVEDIGFPQELLNGKSIACEMPSRKMISCLVPDRPADSNKGTFGHVLLLAGSRGKTGASMLCARAVLKAGAGLVTMGLPEEIMDEFQARVLDEMTLPLPSKGGMLSADAKDGVLAFIQKRADVLAMGPGLGTSPDLELLIPWLVRTCTAPMVIDADALNNLKGNTGIFKQAKAPIIITPHPGEMARLVGSPIPEINKNRIEAASALSRETGAYVVLKGVPTVSAGPEGKVYLNPTGSPAMAKAGMGDVLTGIMAGMLAQGLAPLDAAVFSVYLHGLAGEIAARRFGLHSALASGLHDTIAEAFETIQDATDTPHLP
ncbi:MAG: NAD(P)H-hydrate dehydratase [Nitrospiraceae bacterium]|nr:NAD(P)H-hydrate dehydratase [Nitrospiraceae bacterium]